MSDHTPTPTAVEHQPDCAGWEGWSDDSGICQSWCYGCMRCEPTREGDHLVCGECFHVFRTAEELLHRHLVSLGVEGVTVDVADIFSCPVCAHDF